MPAVTESAAARSRVGSIDTLRGLVMILMALDHVRDFLGVPGISPTDPARASAALFFTRWITHICAPTFFLLVGTGSYLAAGRRSTSEISRFLLTRGLWLIVLELTLLRCFGYQFNVDYHVTMLVVLWALGWSMIALAALVHAPISVIATVGVVMIATHNLFDGVKASAFGALAPLWSILHAPGLIQIDPTHIVFVSYPLMPWIGVTAVGFALGKLFALAPERRRAILQRLGWSLIAAFVVLRALNVYGDPVPWRVQATTTATVLSFLNANKYPPSLLYLLMTLGSSLLILSRLDRGTPRWLQPAHLFGRVPLFYFIVHLPLIHAIAVVACLVRYGSAHWMFESPTLDRYPFTAPPGWGFSLPVVYLLWILVVVSLYPLCVWFAGVKARNRDNVWLSYL